MEKIIALILAFGSLSMKAQVSDVFCSVNDSLSICFFMYDDSIELRIANNKEHAIMFDTARLNPEEGLYKDGLPIEEFNNDFLELPRESSPLILASGETFRITRKIRHENISVKFLYLILGEPYYNEGGTINYLDIDMVTLSNFYTNLKW